MIEKKLLQQAVKALQDLTEKHYEDSSKKKSLLDSENELPIYLQVNLKKIPNRKSMKTIKINLPHPLIKDKTEVCLITGDLDKKNHKAEIEPDVLHYKELLEKHGIKDISEVMTLRQLRTEYKPYEAKQKLLAAYDVFLADRKIFECLPRVLGKHFYRKRKFPIKITMNTPNLKQQVEKALSTKVFYMSGHGNSCSSEVAFLDMSASDITDNVIAMAKALSDNLPGSWDNIMGMYLKCPLSKAIPIYISYDNPNKVILEESDDDDDEIIDELSTQSNVGVKVFKDGRVQTFKMPKISETESKCSENSDQVQEIELKKIGRKSQKMSDKTEEVSISSDESDNVSDSASETKENSKSGLVKKEQLESEKRSKKSKIRAAFEETAFSSDESEYRSKSGSITKNLKAEKKKSVLTESKAKKSLIQEQPIIKLEKENQKSKKMKKFNFEESALTQGMSATSNVSDYERDSVFEDKKVRKSIKKETQDSLPTNFSTRKSLILEQPIIKLEKDNKKSKKMKKKTTQKIEESALTQEMSSTSNASDYERDTVFETKKLTKSIKKETQDSLPTNFRARKSKPNGISIIPKNKRKREESLLKSDADRSFNQTPVQVRKKGKFQLNAETHQNGEMKRKEKRQNRQQKKKFVY